MTVMVSMLLIFFIIMKLMESDSVLQVLIGLDFLSSMVFILLFTFLFSSSPGILSSVIFILFMATEGVLGLSILSSSIIRLEGSSFQLLSCSKL